MPKRRLLLLCVKKRTMLLLVERRKRVMSIYVRWMKKELVVEKSSHVSWRTSTEAREELALGKVQRRNELIKRMERERTDALEHEEVVRGQLNDITTLIHQQREEMAQKHKLMEERWNEKQGHREEKEARQDELIRLARGILHDREQERAEREAEREANAGQPTIEQVLELLREQGERMQTSTDSLAEAWRADSVRQHQETIEAVRATATQTVRLDLL